MLDHLSAMESGVKAHIARDVLCQLWREGDLRDVKEGMKWDLILCCIG